MFRPFGFHALDGRPTRPQQICDTPRPLLAPAPTQSRTEAGHLARRAPPRPANSPPRPGDDHTGDARRPQPRPVPRRTAVPTPSATPPEGVRRISTTECTANARGCRESTNPHLFRERDAGANNEYAYGYPATAILRGCCDADKETKIRELPNIRHRAPPMATITYPTKVAEVIPILPLGTSP